VTQGAKNAEKPAPTPGLETAVGGADKKSEKQIAASAANISAAAPPLVSETVTRKVEIGGVKAPAEAEQKPSKQPVQLVTFDLADAGSSGPSPIISSEAAPATEQRRPLSAIIGSIAIPDAEKKQSVVPVDLAAITPAKPKPVSEKPVVKKEEAKPKPPAHPKRYWVQIATGSDLKALKYDYRRMSKKNADLFSDTNGWTSPWGKTKRLVVGPFDNFDSAKKFEAGFRKDGGDGFAWVSANGTEVNKLN
jgi:hypothetical protein